MPLGISDRNTLNFLKLGAISWYKFTQMAPSLILYTDFLIKICTIVFILCYQIIKIKDIYQSEDTGRVYAIIGTGPWATHMVRMGDLVPRAPCW